jgi:peroxiredoxin Q/BCP
MKKLIMALAAFFFPSLLLALAPGQPVPSLEAKNQDGKVVRLADYRGKFLLVYFYPADNTPGCTAEAQSLRDQYGALKKLDAAVLGVSRQGEASHRGFREKQNLPFDLLVDADGALAKALGVGTIPVVGLSRRQSVLIGPDGRVARFYDDVNPSRHAAEVIADIKLMRDAPAAR